MRSPPKSLAILKLMMIMHQMQEHAQYSNTPVEDTSTMLPTSTSMRKVCRQINTILNTVFLPIRGPSLIVAPPPEKPLNQDNITNIC